MQEFKFLIIAIVVDLQSVGCQREHTHTHTYRHHVTKEMTTGMEYFYSHAFDEGIM